MRFIPKRLVDILQFFLKVSFKFHIWNKFKYITKIEKNLQKLYMYMYIYATIKIMNKIDIYILS